MPIAGSTLAKTATAIAAATRSGVPAKIDAARRAHAVAKLAQQITQTLADAPPLTVEERETLATLIWMPAPRTLRRPVAVDERIAAGGVE